MTITIGLVANVYNEAKALPGWLETHTQFFDDIRILHSGPNGEYSNDGTIELLSKWKIPVEFTSINEGFGVVRTKAIQMSPCDYVLIMDADERFYHTHKIMICHGNGTPANEVSRILASYGSSSKYPDWDTIKQLGSELKVERKEPFNQGELLRWVLRDNKPDVVAMIRRHWHDFSFKKPTQNWFHEPDWQMRLVRRDSSIFFDTSVRMHERLIGANSSYRASMYDGPFLDHFHFLYKSQEQEQRCHDVAIYDSVHEGRQPPTWEEFRSNIK